MTGRRTRRQVSHTAADEAIARIAARRHRFGDPDEEKLTDAPLAVVEYVLTCQQVHAGVLADDVLDALILLEYARDHVPAIPRRLDQYEYELLMTGSRAGLSLSAMAVPLGLRSRQAVEHRILRHRSAARGGPRHETAERRARDNERAARSWSGRHGPSLVAAASLLLDEAARFAEAGLAEDLDDLAVTLAGVPGPADEGYATAIGYVASRIRLLDADAAEWESATGRAEERPLTGPLRPAARLAAEHRRYV